MRRFRLLVDGEYVGCAKDQIFYECEKISDTGRTVKYYQEMYPEDWQEIIDEPKPLHKYTDLGYFAGLALGGVTSNQEFLKNLNAEPSLVIKACIEIAKELIKQLDSANNPTAD